MIYKSFHELASLFPMLQDNEMDLLAQDIKANGLKYPITLYEDKILDGRNRYKACHIAGIDPEFVDYTGDNPLKHVISLNLNRRHLNESQRAVVAERLANMRQGDNQYEVGCLNLDTHNQLSANLQKVIPVQPNLNLDDVGFDKKVKLPSNYDWNSNPKNSHGVSLQQAASLLNVSRANVANVREIKAKAPERIAEIESGAKTVHQVQVEIKKQSQKDEKVFESKQMPQGVFDLVYCDPPWKYDFAETDNRKIENQYPTMTVDEISQMELPSMANNSLLLMWATAPKLLEALKVISEWGFTYKTHGIWDKVKIGMGYWFRGQHELLIVATKGIFSPPGPTNRNSSIYVEARGHHSSKPDFFYDWIEKAFPLSHKIELFSRTKRDGWEAWGNE